MKKIIFGILIGLSISLPTLSFADSALQKVEAYLSPSLPITMDGKQLELHNAPINYNGNIYLPLRETATILGKNVKWNQSTSTIELLTVNTNGETKMSQNIGAGIVYYNFTDISNKYPFYFHSYDKDGKLFVTFEEKEYHLIRLEKDIFVKGEDSFYSEETLLQYLNKERLNEFQKYNINFETKEVTPIK